MELILLMRMESEKLGKNAGYSIHVIKINGESKCFTLPMVNGQREVSEGSPNWI